MQAHHDADNFVKGQYWENGKGCVVGCLIKSGNHIEYEKRFGIPVMLANLEDNIFEGLPDKDSKEWPLQFLNAFEVGSAAYKRMRDNLLELIKEALGLNQ